MRASTTPETSRDAHTLLRQLAIALVVLTALTAPLAGIAVASHNDVSTYSVHDPSNHLSVTANAIDADATTATTFQNYLSVWNATGGPGTDSAFLNVSLLIEGTSSFTEYRSAFVGINDTSESEQVGWVFDYEGDGSNAWDIEAVGNSTTTILEDGLQTNDQVWVSTHYRADGGTAEIRVHNDSAHTDLWDSATVNYDGNQDYDRLDALQVSPESIGSAWSFDVFTLSDYHLQLVGVDEVVVDLPDRFNRNETQSYSVTAIYGDGQSVDVTGQANEQSNATDILTLDTAQALANAQDASGYVIVNATFDGVEGSATTVVHNRSLQDIRFIDQGKVAATVLQDLGIWLLIILSIIVAVGCDDIWEEELAIMLFVGGVAGIWLAGFASIYLPVASLLVGGSVIFSGVAAPALDLG